MSENKVKEKAKNILQKMRPMDYMILGIFVFLIILFGLFYVGKKAYAPTPVENEGKVAYEIYFKNVPISRGGTDEIVIPFFVGNETFVTIRNVPHAKLKITNVRYDHKKTMVPTGNVNNPYVLVDDEENPLAYDFLVTVEDNGKFTDDGVVSGGNKIKIGLPITLESSTYRLDGKITNVKILTTKNNDDE